MALISILFGLVSLVYLWFLGLSNVLPTLGWSAVLLPMSWVGLYLSAQLKAYSRSILGFVLMLFGFIILNHIGRLIFEKVIATTSIWLFLLQAIVVWLPYLFAITIMTKESPKRLNFKDGTVYFSLWLTWLGIWSLTIFAPLWDDRLSPFRLLILLFAPTILYAFLVYGMFMRMTRDEFEYLLNAPIRAPNQAKRFKVSMVLFIVLTIFSLGFEFFRGMWPFALLGCFSLIFLSGSIYRIYRHVFFPLPPQNDRIPVFHFPCSFTVMFFATMTLPVWFILYVVLVARWGLR